MRAIAARHRILRPHRAGAMGRDDRGNGFGQAELRVLRDRLSPHSEGFHLALDLGMN